MFSRKMFSHARSGVSHRWILALNIVLLASLNARVVLSETSVVSQWIGPSSGSFNDPNNWDKGVPTQYSVATFSKSNTPYEINVDGRTEFSALRIGSNTVTLRSSASDSQFVISNWAGTPGGAVVIGEKPGEPANLNVYLPYFSPKDIYIGNVVRSVASLSVIGGKLFSGAIVGGAGEGHLLVSNGGYVNGALGLGTSLTGVGTAIIDGAGSTLTNGATVGAGGTGELTIRNGGYCRGLIAIGTVPYCSGRVVVDGIGSKVDSSIYVGKGGSAQLQITDGAQVSGGDAVIGDGSVFGTQSTASIQGAGSLWRISNLNMGAKGETGILQITQGGSVITNKCTLGGIGGMTQVTVDGVGSSWKLNGDLDSSSHLVSSVTSITNGGILTCYNASMQTASAGGLSFTVDGMGSIFRATSKCDFANGAFFVTRGGLANAPYLSVGGACTVDGLGSQIASSKLEVSGNLIVSNGGAVSTFTGGSDDAIDNGSVTVTGPGSKWDTTYLNVSKDFSLTIKDGGKVNVGNYARVYHAKLTASGAIDGNLQNQGALAPGLPLGLLIINGSYMQTTIGATSPLSVLQIQLGGSANGNFDRLAVTGAMTLSGALDVSLLNGFMPSVGNSFDILDWSTLSGAFSTIQLPTLTDALTWDTSRLYVDGTISVTTVPEPNAIILLTAGMLGIALPFGKIRRWFSRRRRFEELRLLRRLRDVLPRIEEQKGDKRE